MCSRVTGTDNIRLHIATFIEKHTNHLFAGFARLETLDDVWGERITGRARIPIVAFCERCHKNGTTYELTLPHVQYLDVIFVGPTARVVTEPAGPDIAPYHPRQPHLFQEAA